jgi:uncharacterized protein
MTAHTIVHANDVLPLTCSRSGTCCHGKMVWLNPWELACLAQAKGLPTHTFRDQFTEFGGIRLRFNGAPGWKGLPACSQFDPERGCSVHTGRPLACRLYPLGRQLVGKKQQYIFDGEQFPCLAGCAEVKELPQMTVSEYLNGQRVDAGQLAQDAYLHTMQRLADGAFVLLIESGLAASGDKKTLRGWRNHGQQHPKERAQQIPSEWRDRLLIPKLTSTIDHPQAFAEEHFQLLQQHAQSAFAHHHTQENLSQASCLMMAMALHLGRSLGSDPEQLVNRWILTAKKHGARE